jgi:hypothetical protein
VDPLKREFIDLARRSGWHDAEIARQLELTRGGVHGLLKGDTVPSRSILKLFQMVLLREKPELMTSRAGEQSLAEAPDPAIHAIMAELEELKESNPERFQTVREVITVYHTMFSPRRGARKTATRPEPKVTPAKHTPAQDLTLRAAGSKRKQPKSS